LKVTVDYREKASGLIDLLACEECRNRDRERCPYGDYVINNAITMERKTARDFLISLIDGRLFGQLSKAEKDIASILSC
jgi:DNA excision repair protein ERCC-4